MGMEVLGVVASFATIVSGLGWILDRNSKKFESIQRKNDDILRGFTTKVEHLEQALVQVRLDLPEKYVTKEELMMHIRGEERWHQSVDNRLEDIRSEISSIREWRHR